MFSRFRPTDPKDWKRLVRLHPLYERGQRESNLLLEMDELQALAARLRKMRLAYAAQLGVDAGREAMRRALFRDFRDPNVYGPSDRKRALRLAELQEMSRKALDKTSLAPRLVRRYGDPDPDDVYVED